MQGFYSRSDGGLLPSGGLWTRKLVPRWAAWGPPASPLLRESHWGSEVHCGGCDFCIQSSDASGQPDAQKPRSLKHDVPEVLVKYDIGTSVGLLWPTFYEAVPTPV